MIRSNAHTPEPETVGQSVGQVVHDVVSLAELQVQLVKTDARESASRAMKPLAILVLGVVLLLATLPVCLAALALGLAALGVPLAGAFASVALLSLAAAIGMAFWAQRKFHEMPAAFKRSQEELAHNIAWIKSAVLDLTPRQGRGGSDPSRAWQGRG